MKQNRIIEELKKQIEKFVSFQFSLITVIQNALMILMSYEAKETCSSMISSLFLSSLLSFLSSLFFYIFLSSFSSDSFLLMTSSFFSSLMLIMQFIIEEMKNTISFDMNFLFHSFY